MIRVVALTFAPAYYFHGEDDYLKNEELRRLIDAAVDPATRDFNFETLRGADIDADNRAGAANLLSHPASHVTATAANFEHALTFAERYALEGCLRSRAVNFLQQTESLQVFAAGGQDVVLGVLGHDRFGR